MAEKAFSKVFLISPDLRRFSEFSKRSLDIIVSLVALILLAPFFGLIALAVRRDSPGPVFFRGRRVGRGGIVFPILKFRTMYESSESYSGPKVTAHDDMRITPLGHWLRNTKLNELPQLWNVLKGEMSLVGPRPEDPDIAASWPKDVWEEVLSVRPGITSPASVQYHNEETLLSVGNVLQKYIQEVGPDKMRLDQMYVRYRSFWLDMDTILWTVLILLPKVRVETIPEHFLFVGPVTRLMRRYLHWFTIDVVVTFTAIAFTGVLWRISRPLDVGIVNDVIATLGFSLLFSVIGALLGVNRISWSKATFTDVYDLLPSWMLATIITFTLNRILKLFPSAMILTASSLALFGYIFTRYRSRLITGFLSRIISPPTHLELRRERVLIIGSGPAAQHMAWMLHHPTNTNKYRVVGFVDDNLFHHGMRIYGSKVLGTSKDIPDLIRKYNVARVFLADQSMPMKQYQAIARMCERSTARLSVIPDFLATLSRMVEINPIMIGHQTLDIPQTGRAPAEANVPTEPAKFNPCSHCVFHQARSYTEQRPGPDQTA